MSKDDKNIEQATEKTLSQAASIGHIAGSKKTVDAAINEMIRRTSF